MAETKTAEVITKCDSESEAVPIQPEETEFEGADGDLEKVLAPLEDPYKKAISYLEEHHIIQIFQVLTTGIVYERPDDPLDYMIEQVDKLQHEERFQVKKQQSTDFI